MLVRGVRESAGANNVMVLIKIAAILIFFFGAARAVNTANWHPFMPNGFSGVLTGGAIVFFTYIGFDAVSTAAEECRNPQRDLPLGIMLTLVICALLYAGVSLVLTGIAHWNTLNNDAPVANALKALGYNRLRLIVTRGRADGHDLARCWCASTGRRASGSRCRATACCRRCFRAVHPQLRDAAHQHLDRRLRRRAFPRASGTSTRSPT